VDSPPLEGPLSSRQGIQGCGGHGLMVPIMPVGVGHPWGQPKVPQRKVIELSARSHLPWHQTEETLYYAGLRGLSKRRIIFFAARRGAWPAWTTRLSSVSL